ncbi:MAG: tetratricopeptide (TPR) repeat protein [Limisphaerales bacterium]
MQPLFCMMTEAARLRSQAFETAKSGNLAESISLYRQAVSLADPERVDMGMIHGEFGSVLTMSGDLKAAREQRELAIEAEIKFMGYDSLAVAVARYFLGESLLKMGEFETAVAAVQESLGLTKLDGLLRMVEALGNWGEGRKTEANAAAKLALESALDKQRATVIDRLREILDDTAS